MAVSRRMHQASRACPLVLCTGLPEPMEFAVQRSWPMPKIDPDFGLHEVHQCDLQDSTLDRAHSIAHEAQWSVVDSSAHWGLRLVESPHCH